MKNYIIYALMSIVTFVTSVLALRAGILGDFSRGLALTGLVVLPFILLFCVLRIFKIRQENNWLAKFEEV